MIDWKQILKDAPVLLKRVSARDGVDDLAQSLTKFWAHRIETGKVNPSKGESSALGEAALELYFAQIFNPKGMFLDLRLKNFGFDENQKVVFQPSGFWIQWQEPFRLGLLNIYTGYYEGKDELLTQGLLQVGLVQTDTPIAKVQEVKAMLLSHIGGDYKQQKFLIADFTASFEKFFQFLLENKIRLGADFLYLGIYLASLYHCLQEVGGAYDVQQAFQTSKA